MFSGLGIATSGLRAAQVNLAVTGHNIANAEISGFSRQRIVQTTSFPRNIGMNAGNSMNVIGMGTDWNAVQQIRNEFLDFHYRQNVGRLQFYSTMVQTGLVVESALGELYGAYNFQSVVNNLWNSIQELTANPAGLDTRQMLLANLNAFVNKAQSVYDTLFEYQQNLDMQIREMVNGRDGINATVAQINQLNFMIRAAEATGDNANDFRDERNRAVDRLAEMIPIDIMICNFGDVNITSMGHQILVQGHQSVLGLRYISNEFNFVEPVFTNSPTILSAGTIPGTEFRTFMNYQRDINDRLGNDFGALKALMLSRGNSPAYAGSADRQPPVQPNVTDINPNTGVAFGVATDPDFIQAMRDYHADVHNFNAYMWGVRHAMIPEIQMNLDRIVTNVVTMLNDAVTGRLRGDDGQFLFYEVYPVGHAQAGEPRYAYDSLGDPIYIHRRTGEPVDATHPDRIHARVPRVPLDANRQEGIPIFIRNMDDPENAVWPFPEPSHSVGPHLFPQKLSINNIRINPLLLQSGGHNHLAFSLTGAESDTDLLNALAETWLSDRGPYSIQIGNRFFNVQDAYINMTGDLSTRIHEASGFVGAQSTLTIQADSRRNAVKGVSMDEELNNMLRFQFAFQAASRAINVIDSMIDQVVNRTGRTGL